jgi:hypothetical protein
MNKIKIKKKKKRKENTPNFSTYQLCDLGQITPPPGASVSFFVKWR